MRRENAKTMLITFKAQGIVIYEFLSQGQPITDDFYVEVLKKLKERVNRVRSDIDLVGVLLSHSNWKLHHDNAP